jgi:hypothetical protein
VEQLRIRWFIEDQQQRRAIEGVDSTLKAQRVYEMQTHKSDRERHMRQLASMLFFDVQQQESRFNLTRTVGVPEPVRHENLTLEEAEEVLKTWKLRGFHGG